jgi:4-alpha-glucanotransferase
MKIEFYLRFKTVVGQALFVTGNHPLLGGNIAGSAFPLSFLNNEFWYGVIEITEFDESFHYRYVFQNEHGEINKEAEKSRQLDLKKLASDVIVIDSWNDESFYENAFYTAPFREIFFKEGKKQKSKKDGDFTHQFKVKAPLLSQNEAVCLNDLFLGEESRTTSSALYVAAILHLEKSAVPYLSR